MLTPVTTSSRTTGPVKLNVILAERLMELRLARHIQASRSAGGQR